MKKKTKTIEEQERKQIEAIEKHVKQLAKSSSEKESERIDEIQNLSKQIDFNNLIYSFKGESSPKNFINFKGPLIFYKNIKGSYTILDQI